MPSFRGWDEAFYMSQMSSAILDRDLMLQNDLLIYPNDVCERIRSVSVLRPDGVHIHAFSIGPSVFYSMVMIPVYGFGVERFGLGARRALALWIVFFGVLGLMGLDGILAEFGFRASTRYMAIIAAIFSTPFLWYGTRDTISSHFPATLATIFSLLFWIKWLKHPRYGVAWAAGLCSGWLVITRWQALVFLLCVSPSIVIEMTEKSGRLIRLKSLIIGLVSFLLVVGIQMSVWRIHYGMWIAHPVHTGFVDLSSPDMLPFTFSGFHGLVPWAPGLLIGWIGLICMGFRKQSAAHRWLVWGFLAGMIIQFYINICVWDWWGGSSYGPRRMTFLLAPATLGWAYILQRSHGWMRIMLSFIVIAWGLFTFSAYSEGVDDLKLLFSGKPDTWRPVECKAPEDAIETRWDRWEVGFKRLTKFNFALKEPSRKRHRCAASVLLGLITGLAVLVYRLLDRGGLFKKIILSGATIYVLLVLIVLNACFPSNEPWHDHWAAVVRDQPARLPDAEASVGYLEATELIRVVTRLKQHDYRDFQMKDADNLEIYPGITLRAVNHCIEN